MKLAAHSFMESFTEHLFKLGKAFLTVAVDAEVKFLLHP